MRRTLLGAAAFALGAALLAGCNGGPQEITFVDPVRNGFVREGEPIAVRVRAERHDEVRLTADGEPAGEAPARGAGGVFEVELAAMMPGRHRLVAEVPGVPGAADVRDVFVARTAHAPVDGYGFAQGASHVITLSGAKPAAGGLYEGRLTVFGLVTTAGGFVRELTGDGVYAEVSDGGLVAWTDGWTGSKGTLHLAPLDGPEVAVFEDARDAIFGKDGRTLGVLDDGVVVRTPDGEVRRVVPSSRAFVFAGPASDLVSFDGDGGDSRRTASFAASPDYETVTVLATPVYPLVANNPVHRESALIEWHAEGEPRGSLVLYDYETATVERPFDGVLALTFSRDGAWLVALVDSPEGELMGSVGLLSRTAPGVPMVHAGDFRKVSFDRGTTRVFAHESTAIGAVHRAWLDSPAPVFEVIATGVQEMFVLPGDRMLLLHDQGDVSVVQPDDSILELGTAGGDGTLSVSPDGEHLVFTAAGEGGRIVARRADLVAESVGDLGTIEARRPIALAGGAVAWAEPSADGEGEVLWMLPAFPGSFGGPRVVSASLQTAGVFPVAPGGGAFAAVADGRALCVRASGMAKELGPPDPGRPTPFFLEDGRVGRFGVDRGEERVLFLQRCD